MPRASLDELEAAIASYREMESVVGIVLVGSASRAYSDALSDYDVEVVLEDDGYFKLDPESTVSYFADGAIECLLIPLSELATKAHSSSDIDHWPYEECQMLFDRDDVTGRVLGSVVQLPEEVRAPRIKLHYFEFLFSANRLERLLSRGSELNLRLTAAQAVASAIRVLFLLRRRWPPPVHWASHQLGALDCSLDAQALLLELTRGPDARTARKAIAAIDAAVAAEVPSLAHAKRALTAEVTSPAFRSVRERYGIL